MRLSLATTLQSHAALHDLFASPEQLTFDRLTAYLDLLAHLERIDAKLARTARQLLDKGGGTEEQDKVCRTYARDAEGRRKRRNGYIGWSLMLRRWYINNLLLTTHETTPDEPLTPFLESQIYKLCPPSDMEYPDPPLFVRNTEQGEHAVIDRTVEVYEEVIVSVDEHDDWRPSFLPYAKPLGDILHAIQRYVTSVSNASRRLKRAFPDDKASPSASEVDKKGKGVAVSPPNRPVVKDDPKESRTLLRPPVPVEPVVSEHTVVLASEESTHNVSLDKANPQTGPRREKESRATRAVLAFFGDPETNSVEEHTSTRSAASVGTADTSSSSRSSASSRRNGGTSLREKHDLEPLVPPEPSTDMSASRPPVAPPRARRRQRTSMPGYDILQRRIRERSRMLSETPGPEIRARSESVAPERTRRASMGPREMREPTPAPEVGAEWVPSPGMKFEVGPDGKLVYLGMGGVPSPAVATVTTPTMLPRRIEPGLMQSLQKVKQAAAATRTPPTGHNVQSPASTSSRRREFIKPGLPRTIAPLRNGTPQRAADAEAPLVKEEQGEGAEKGRESSRIKTPVPGLSRIPLRVGNSASLPSAGIKRIIEKPVDVAPSAQTNGIPSRLDQGATKSTTASTPTPIASITRKRPAPFEDSTVERLPPNYRSTAERRLTASSRAATAFSRAQREAWRT